MPYTVLPGKENDFLSCYFHKFGEEIEYKGTMMPAEHLAYFTIEECRSMKGVSAERIMTLAKETYDLGIKLTPLLAKKLAKAEHKGKTSSFIGKYKDSGFTKCPVKGKKETEESLRVLFSAQRRFRGRIPRILPQIAAVCDYYKIPLEDAANKFSIQSVQHLLELGVSKVETVLLYTHLSERQLSNISNNLYLTQMVATLIDKSYKKSKENLLEAACWIADHANSDLKLLEKVYDKASDLKLDSSISVDNVKTQFSNRKAANEVAKIEKAYKECHFKLKNCVCELKKTTSQTDRYKAEILEGDDPRQVMLGYDTECCQHLGDAGESAMMHGLLHPKAGFWVVTKRDSGKVVAQAESWELNRNTLVFDNIEFANDAEIAQYKEIIGKWVAESSYKNVIMGCGYNEFVNDSFERAGAVTPPVTAYELYVLSYEDECDAREEICELSSEREAQELMERGEITYFDYVYCDSERESVYLKKNGRIAEFFAEYSNKEAIENEEDYERE